MIKTKNAIKILDRVTGDDPELHAVVAEAKLNYRVAQMIFRARTRSGLTQTELANLIGTRQPVIARLEDADYVGHSLSMLRRIAEALDRRVDIRFVPVKRKLQLV